MLALDTFPLDDVALVRAPATGVVAVVDRDARAILAGLCAGRAVPEIARSHARATGRALSTALAEVAALERCWRALADPPDAGPLPPLPSEPRRPPALDSLCHLGERPVRLRVWPPGLAHVLAAVTAPCRSPPDATGGRAPEITIHRRDGRYLLAVDEVVCVATADLMFARSEALRRLVLAAHPTRAWLAVLHGAGVAGATGAALLCGWSGAGKSTLTGLLVASGLALVTDDYAPIEADSGSLWPIPFGLSVKEGSWPILAPHFPALSRAPLVRTRGRRQRYLTPPLVATEPQPVRCLVFPRYEPGARLELLPLRPGESLQLCARSGGWYESSPERLAELVAWLGTRPAYALSYGDGAAAVAAVHRLLAG